MIGFVLDCFIIYGFDAGPSQLAGGGGVQADCDEDGHRYYFFDDGARHHCDSSGVFVRILATSRASC